jgi:phosphate transport system protein
MTEHISKQFDADLEAIRSGVLAMGGLVEKQLTRAIAVLQNPEEPVVEQVARDEATINQMQMSVDQQCYQLIARRQPAASDLRMVMTVTKIVNELERIGDEVKKIAFKAHALPPADKLALARQHEIARVAVLARQMLQMALDSFARLDVVESAEIVRRDEAVDSAFQAITRQLVSYMMEDPRLISPALELLFIAKWLERIGDHSKNIAEHVVQAVKGVDVRHASPDEITAEVNA